VALCAKLQRKAEAAKSRKGHTPWSAVVASKRAAVTASGGVLYDAAFEKAEKQATAERVLNSDAQRDAVLALMGSAPYWGGPAAQQWSRISHAAPSIALPLARFLVLAASQQTRELIGEYLSDWCAKKEGRGGGGGGGGGRSRGRGRGARGRGAQRSKLSATAAQEQPPAAAVLGQRGSESARRLRARLCRGYKDASARHTALVVPSAAALKAASAAVRKDIQAYCKGPKGEVPVKWKRSAAHKKLLAKHKAEDAFDVLEAIDALLPRDISVPPSAQSATS